MRLEGILLVLCFTQCLCALHVDIAADIEPASAAVATATAGSADASYVFIVVIYWDSGIHGCLLYTSDAADE